MFIAKCIVDVLRTISGVDLQVGSTTDLDTPVHTFQNVEVNIHVYVGSKDPVFDDGSACYLDLGKSIEVEIPVESKLQSLATHLEVEVAGNSESAGDTQFAIQRNEKIPTSVIKSSIETWSCSTDREGRRAIAIQGEAVMKIIQAAVTIAILVFI